MTHPAGEGMTDDELVQEVAEQTSSDLRAEPEFEEEAGGATSDVEAAKDPEKQV